MNPAELAARAHAVPRDYASIAVDLAEAATRLRAIAGGVRLGGPTPEALADADRIVTGCGSLLRELRQVIPR
ncbi:MAG TPA: hypothetical protein VN693_06480 [Rhodanobacteraceae bacterium]|nr:hypothetical protein [Rhodanobacteraceae bacterium]